MSIYSSTNPTDWSALDGIYIDDTSPPPSVTGVPANIAILVGQFERGSPNIQSVGSTGQLYELYGNNLNFSGNVALQNKKFGLLKIVRVIAASGAANGAHTFQHSATNIVTFTALWAGAYGNSIQVTIATGSNQGSKYTVHDANPNAVWPDEVYDNVLITNTTAQMNAIFGGSNLISVTIVATSSEPSAIGATNLSAGSDGSIADGDYSASITGQCQTGGVGNVLFIDKYDTAIKGYLLTSMAATTDKMCVMDYGSDASASTAIADVPTYRDTQGRLIYTFPYCYTSIAGVSTLVSLAPFYAALLSQISPNIDPAYAANSQFFSGVQSLSKSLQRSDYINLLNAGISAFEDDSDIGIKIKSGVVTQISDSSKIMVFRRRMADYLIQSLAKFLKNYQNAPNSGVNQTNAAGGIASFNRLLEQSGMVPKDSEVQIGKASLIDTKSLNTDDSIAAGMFKIIYRRRIYSSMREIVLQTEIGESVVVTESTG